MPVSLTSNRSHSPSSACSLAAARRTIAVFGEFGCVAEQVEQALANLGHIHAHGAQIPRGVDDQGIRVLFDQRTDERSDFSQERLHRGRLQVQFHLAGFDLGDIEHRVDQFQQVLPGPANLAQVRQIVLFPIVLGHLLQHLAVSDDGVERSAQLMAHIRHESALGAVGLLGQFLGPFHFKVAFLQLFGPQADLALHVLVELPQVVRHGLDGGEQLAGLIAAGDLELGGEVARRNLLGHARGQADRARNRARYEPRHNHHGKYDRAQNAENGPALLVDEGERLALILLHHDSPAEAGNVHPHGAHRIAAVVHVRPVPSLALYGSLHHGTHAAADRHLPGECGVGVEAQRVHDYRFIAHPAADHDFSRVAHAGVSR